jgi:type III restriction enzyme
MADRKPPLAPVKIQHSLFDDALRDTEGAKVKCGGEHFTAIEASESGAKFVRATSVGDFEKHW